ncbi:energy-coupling factor transport system substrate-specific component [Pelagirhabdus alkalitolerans]|uniref:Energy-coupling factor transport system substrate-specific component n=1 Tax=Pelagirhabdus alkalitolerans TaxID=1612202 RepID=A0A1G6GR20_9BACI|nr:ECF transporter S component [Pelagirhabdus alkalitolerans]SDB84492.1 energy-coupling factor transport system substrate-specific component [Pelagirhabdus alkalitolerans]
MSKWTLKEVIVMAALSVVFGVIYLAFIPIGGILVGFMGPIGYEPIFGIWFIVSIIAAYIFQKPGAAFISETIAATIEVMLGNALGPLIIVVGIIQGIGAEAVFAATRWKNYSLWVLMLAGMGSAVTSFIWGMFQNGYIAFAPSYILAMFVIRLISGALIGGWLGKVISDALAKTGVLASFALGKQYKKRKKAA